MKYYKYIDELLSLVGDYEDDVNEDGREKAHTDANCIDPEWVFVMTESELRNAFDILDDNIGMPTDPTDDQGKSNYLMHDLHTNEFTHAGEYFKKEHAVRDFKNEGDEAELITFFSEEEAILLHGQIVDLFDDLQLSTGPK